jgi:choline dehydrogenase-like flavoprotein
MGILRVHARYFLKTSRRVETRRQFIGKRLVVHKAVCMGRADRLLVQRFGIEGAAFDPGDLRPHQGGPVLKILWARDKWAIADYVRRNVQTYWHPVGTCAMGLHERAVVNPRLQVHGVERLRFANGSVMPTITTGNTNAPTIMIGERAARLILA